jgi:16S rRNA (guanine(1405)-N(7))-methyltransferase
MAVIDPETLDKLIAAVGHGRKYSHIMPTLIKRITCEEEEKFRKPFQVIKSARSRLHQLGGAFQGKNINYTLWEARLKDLPVDVHHPTVLQYCQELMRLHASSLERLSILPDFFKTTLGAVGPIYSVLDLACGLNPLAIPWMGLNDTFTYTACDIYEDMIGFLNNFFFHFSSDATAFTCDITQMREFPRVQLALLLKTLPCLEHLNKNIGSQVLENIHADHILVSFPVKSLSGHEKGMRENYQSYFYSLINPSDWIIRTFEFSTELAFLLSRNQ